MSHRPAEPHRPSRPRRSVLTFRTEWVPNPIWYQKTVLWKSNCFYTGCIFCKYFLFCFPFVCTEIIPESPVCLIGTLKAQKGKRNLGVSSAGTFRENMADTRWPGLQLPEAQEGKEMQGRKSSGEEASSVFSALTLEGFGQRCLENGLLLTHLSSMTHPQEC